MKYLLEITRSSYFVVGSLLVLGILATFMRELILAYYYGTSREIEIFRLSILVPHMLTQTCAPAFVAVCLTILNKEKELKVGKPEQTIFYCNLLFSFGLTLIGIGTLKLQSQILAPGFDEQTQAYLSSALQYSWLYFLFASLSFTNRSRLLDLDIFWPGPASSSLISFSLIIVVFCYQFIPFLESEHNALSVAIVFSGLSVFATHHIAANLYGLEKIRLKIGFSNYKLLRMFFYMATGAVLFKLLNFVPRLIDRIIATTMEQGVLACLEYGFGILNIFGILIGTSLATVITPRFLKRYSAVGLERAFYEFRKVMLIGFCASVLFAGILIIFSEDAISILFQRGNFDRQAVELTASIFKWQILALPLINMTLVISQIFILIERIRLLLFAVALKICLKLLSFVLLQNFFQEKIFGITLFFSEMGFLLLLLLFLHVHPKTNDS